MQQHIVVKVKMRKIVMNEDRYYIDLKLNSQSWFEAQTIRIKGSYLLSEVDAVIESYKIIDVSLVAIEMKKLIGIEHLQRSVINGWRTDSMHRRFFLQQVE